MNPTLPAPIWHDVDPTAPARHCCLLCREEAIAERCPAFRFDWEDASVDSHAPTVRYVVSAER